MNLTDKRVIVTGGAKGLGRVLVESLHARGARVGVFDRDAQALSELEGELGIAVYECDVADPASVAHATAQYHESSGCADVLINNAGIIHSEPLVRIEASGTIRHDPEHWTRVIGVNLSSVFYMSSYVAERMIATRTRGVIVNVSSISAGGNAGQSAYGASKAGVEALTTTWARELGALGIRVVAVAPGFIESPSMHAGMPEGVLRDVVRRIPLHRLGTADELAAGVIGVIENDYMNGKVIPLDGGLSL